MADVPNTLTVPIRQLGAERSDFPLVAYAADMEQVGFQALSASRPDLSPQAIRWVYDPENLEKIQQHIELYQALGKTGICLVAFDPEKARGVVGFSVLRSGTDASSQLWPKRQLRSPNRVSNFIALNVLPGPQCQAIGRALIRTTAHIATNHHRQGWVSVNVARGDEQARKLFGEAGFRESHSTPSGVHHLVAANWTVVLRETSPSKHLPERKKVPPKPEEGLTRRSLRSILKGKK